MSISRKEDLTPNLESHPREMADDILRQLVDFCEILERLSIRCSESLDDPKFILEFSKLVDGISTVVEGLAVVKRVLKIQSESIPSLHGLEQSLLCILQDLLLHQEKKETAAMGPILRERLVENLQNWREVALPALVRSRDS